MDLIIPYGTVIAYAGELVLQELPTATELIHPMYPRRHTGWFVCNGASLLQSRYWNLYQAIGKIYGTSTENGNTQFVLPDYQGQFLRGLLPKETANPSNEARTKASGPDAKENGVGSTQENMVQMHEHQYQMYPGTNTTADPGSPSTTAEAQPDYTKGLFTDDSGQTSLSGTETRPQNIYVTYLIYAGLPQ